jgi:hypothetical protein
MKIIFPAVLLAFIPLASYAGSANISKSQFKDQWPLTVDSGTLKCEPAPTSLKVQFVTFTSGGKTYALNGIARGQAKQRGWKEIDPIWKDNPEIPGAKINIGPLITLGLTLCR